MNVDTAKQIASLTCGAEPHLIDAIGILRRETAYGFLQARSYLDQHSQDGEAALVLVLCGDFVLNKADLLVEARREHRRLGLYIEQLEAEIVDEGRAH